MSGREAISLPDWPLGTVVLLSTVGEGPHTIPVSAARAASPGAILLGIASSRGSLARLRDDPRVAVCVLTGGDLAITAYGRASVLAEPLVEGVEAVRVEVERVQDHGRPTFVIESGVSWRWTDPEAEARDGEVRAALARLAAG